MVFKFEQGDSLFHRLDPLTKLVWLLCVSIVTLYSTDVYKQLALLALVTLFSIAGARLSVGQLWRRMRWPFYFGIPYFLIQLIFVPVDYAGAISLRLFILVFASMLFIVTTDPRDIVLAMMQHMRLPYRFAYAFVIALRFLPLLEEEAQTMRTAQQLRGFERPRGIRPKWSYYRTFILAIFVNAVRRVENIATVMDLKAFGKHKQRTHLRTMKVQTSGIACIVLSIIGSILFMKWGM